MTKIKQFIQDKSMRFFLNKILIERNLVLFLISEF